MSSDRQLQLRAFAPLDGWAITSEGVSLLLVKSPFRPADRMEIDDSVCAKLIAGGAFETIEKPFDDWASLTSWLQAERRRKLGSDYAQDAVKEAAKVLRYTTRERAGEHVQAARQLLLDGYPQQADRLLQALLGAKAVTEDAGLMQVIFELLRKANNVQPGQTPAAVLASRYPVRNELRLRQQEEQCRSQGGPLAWQGVA